MTFCKIETDLSMLLTCGLFSIALYRLLASLMFCALLKAATGKPGNPRSPKISGYLGEGGNWNCGLLLVICDDSPMSASATMTLTLSGSLRSLVIQISI